MKQRRWWLIWQMQCFVPLASLSLRLIGLRRTWKLLNLLTFSPVPAVDPESEVKQVLAALKYGMAHTQWKGTCLSRSLILWWQLARKGTASQLCLGVGNYDGFRAHAWVEYQGRPLNAGKLVHQRYQTIEQFSLQQLENRT